MHFLLSAILWTFMKSYVKFSFKMFKRYSLTFPQGFPPNLFQMRQYILFYCSFKSRKQMCFRKFREFDLAWFLFIFMVWGIAKNKNDFKKNFHPTLKNISIKKKETGKTGKSSKGKRNIKKVWMYKCWQCLI